MVNEQKQQKYYSFWFFFHADVKLILIDFTLLLYLTTRMDNFEESTNISLPINYEW